MVLPEPNPILPLVFTGLFGVPVAVAQFGIRDIVLVVAAALGLCRLMGHGPYQQVEHGQLTHLRPVLLLTVGIILVLVAVARTLTSRLKFGIADGCGSPLLALRRISLGLTRSCLCRAVEEWAPALNNFGVDRAVAREAAVARRAGAGGGRQRTPAHQRAAAPRRRCACVRASASAR